jgi:hypothetical protein
MWELNALKMNSDKEGLMSKLFVSDYFNNDMYGNRLPFDPYSYAIMFDSESLRGARITLSDVFDNVASVLFKLSSSSGRQLNSMIINRSVDASWDISKPLGQGALLDETEWSKTIFAAGCPCQRWPQPCPCSSGGLSPGGACGTRNP